MVSRFLENDTTSTKIPPSPNKKKSEKNAWELISHCDNYLFHFAKSFMKDFLNLFMWSQGDCKALTSHQGIFFLEQFLILLYSFPPICNWKVLLSQTWLFLSHSAVMRGEWFLGRARLPLFITLPRLFDMMSLQILMGEYHSPIIPRKPPLGTYITKTHVLYQISQIQLSRSIIKVFLISQDR